MGWRPGVHQDASRAARLRRFRPFPPSPGTGRFYPELTFASSIPLQSIAGAEAQLLLELIEVERLGEKLGSSPFVGLASPLVFTVGGHHHVRLL